MYLFYLSFTKNQYSFYLCENRVCLCWEAFWYCWYTLTHWWKVLDTPLPSSQRLTASPICLWALCSGEEKSIWTHKPHLQCVNVTVSNIKYHTRAAGTFTFCAIFTMTLLLLWWFLVAIWSQFQFPWSSHRCHIRETTGEVHHINIFH